MKRIEEVLRECPKHDCAYVLINHRWRRVEEHELRYIGACIAKGELDPEGIKVKHSDGQLNSFDSKGRLEEFIEESNIYRLNSQLSIIVLKREREEHSI